MPSQHKCKYQQIKIGFMGQYKCNRVLSHQLSQSLDFKRVSIYIFIITLIEHQLECFHKCHVGRGLMFRIKLLQITLSFFVYFSLTLFFLNANSSQFLLKFDIIQNFLNFGQCIFLFFHNLKNLSASRFFVNITNITQNILSKKFNSFKY